MHITQNAAAEHLTTLLTLEGTRFPVQKRGKAWYAVAGLLLFAFALYGVLAGLWLLLFICGLMAFVEWKLMHVEGTKQRMLVAKEGVVYDGAFIRWEDIEGCWAVRAGHLADIHVVPRQGKGKDLRIQIPLEQAEQTLLTVGQHTTLLEQTRERLIDTIIRICKL